MHTNALKYLNNEAEIDYLSEMWIVVLRYALLKSWIEVAVLRFSLPTVLLRLGARSLYCIVICPPMCRINSNGSIQCTGSWD